MKTRICLAAVAATAIFSTSPARAQTVLVPWDHSWSFMHPMGAMPDVPAGGDADFDSTWFLPESEFGNQYDGPEFGAVPRLLGDPLVIDSFDSGVSRGPLGYGTIDYFGEPGAEITDFGDDDGDPGNGLSGELTAPESGNRRAAYFRTTFTVPEGGSALVRPVIRCVIDDGAYVYLDGELVAVINMRDTDPENLDTYDTVNAAAAGSSEDVVRAIDLSLPAGSSTGTVEGDPAEAENARIVKQIVGLAAGEHTLAVSARSNSQSSSDICMALELTAEAGCLISAEVNQVVRDDAGTPANPADDTFSFEAVVSGAGAGASWSSNDPAGTSGAYGVPVTVGPFPIASSPVTVTFTAASDPGCTTQVVATAPAGGITAEVLSATRDQRGTLDPADDTFTATVEVGASFASGSWASAGTEPVLVSPGTPTSGAYGVPVAFGPYPISAGPITVDLVDGGDPELGTQLILATPEFIGGKSFGGTPTSLLSSGPLPPQWVNDQATPPTISMSDAGGDVWREFRSEVLDLSSVGAVGFSAEFIARETSSSSNFEDEDGFRARLLLTGAGVPATVDLTAAFDRNSDGMLSGSAAPYDPAQDEFNLSLEATEVTLDNVIDLAALIPAAADSAQLVIEAKGIAGSESFVLRQIAFNDGCSFGVEVADIFRNSNGQPENTAVHTVEFVLRATPIGLVSPAGWDVVFTRGGVPVAGANVAGGAYNTDVLVTGMSATGGPIIATVTDRIDPACTVASLVIVPGPPSVVGSVELGAGSTDLFSDGFANGWASIPGGHEMNQAPALEQFSTEFIDLSTVSGKVYFSMNLRAMETSANSNFEAADTFLAELWLDDGTSVTPVNVVTRFDRDGNGVMNGAGGVANDEFNAGAEPESESIDNLFALSAVIPDNIVRAALRITAQVDAPTEFLQMTDVLFTTTPPDGAGDTDGDGATDDEESIAGTDPADPTSVFRITAFGRPAPGDYQASFPTVTGRFYQGYTSTDQVTWTRDDSIAEIAGDGGAAAWPVGEDGARRFLRIFVSETSGSFPAILP